MLIWCLKSQNKYHQYNIIVFSFLEVSDTLFKDVGLHWLFQSHLLPYLQPFYLVHPDPMFLHIQYLFFKTFPLRNLVCTFTEHVFYWTTGNSCRCEPSIWGEGQDIDIWDYELPFNTKSDQVTKWDTPNESTGKQLWKVISGGYKEKVGRVVYFLQGTIFLLMV